MSLSVLFKEISTDLDLTVFQIGLIWGIPSFTGMFLGLVGGIIGDQFGTRRILIIACIGVGIFGASRGLSTGFTSFVLTSFILGIAMPFISVNIHNTASRWFSSNQLGVANGFISSGFAAGFLLGTSLGATTLSPLLGGWRNVLFMYGLVAMVFAVAWWFLHPADPIKANHPLSLNLLREDFSQVLQSRTIWLIGLGKICVWGCVRGFTGYLPLYLREIGWDPNLADAALSTFFIVSFCGAIPIPLMSDKIGRRKPFLVIAAGTIGIGCLLLSSPTTTIVFAAAALTGIMFDAFMGISITAASELKFLHGALPGTAIGVIFFLSDIGGTIAPPLGNAFADQMPHLPLLIWGSLALLGIIPFMLIKEEAQSPY